MSWSRGTVFGGVAVASAVVVCVPATQARAQWGMMQGGMGGDMSVTRRGFEAYSSLLSLDADQKEVARDLLDGNRSANKALMEDMQAKMRQIGEKARETQNWNLWQEEMPKIAKEFEEKSTKLEKQFFDDLKGLLTAEQADKFGSVERHRRREMQMRYGLAIGASTDLVESLRLAKIDLAKNEPIREAINRYEIDLDSILKNNEKQMKDSQKSIMEGGFNDPSKIETAVKPLMDNAKQIRDLNRQVSKRIEGMITDEKQREVFAMEVKRKDFPRVYKESYVQKAVTEAMKFDGLDQSQKDRLASVQEQYQREASSVNDRWAKALEEREDKAGGRIKMLMNMWEFSNDKEDDVTKAKKARKEIDEAAEKKVEAILTEDQRAKLPQKRPDKGSGGWGMGLFEDFGWDFNKEEDS